MRFFNRITNREAAAMPTQPGGPPLRIHIRWMIRRDMPEVLEIENQSFEYPWSEDDFIRCLRQRNCIGMVAEHDERVVGFMVYELQKLKLHLLNLAVHPDFIRRGAGRALIDKMIRKLSPQRRRQILCEVRESNLAAHLFFKAMGFRAQTVLREFYEDTDEDAYLFVYRYRPLADWPQLPPPALPESHDKAQPSGNYVRPADLEDTDGDECGTS